MVDKVKFGGQKCRTGAENGGQNHSAYQLTLKEGVPPPPWNYLTDQKPENTGNSADNDQNLTHEILDM